MSNNSCDGQDSKAAYFKLLTATLHHAGTGMPQLIVDSEALLSNITLAARMLTHVASTTNQNIASSKHQKRSQQFYQQPNQHKPSPRLVVKSLACIELLKTITQQFQQNGINCNRFMVFHAMHLTELLRAFVDADVLLGKPMPIQAVRSFYEQNEQYRQSKIQWLVDDTHRLNEYIKCAQILGVKLDINLEIDVGLHRGGISSLAQMRQILEQFGKHASDIRLSGLMGYDAHVAKIPQIIKSTKKTYQQSQEIYRTFINLIKNEYPQLWHEALCFNGAGSPTFVLHTQSTVCNDIAFGSMLLKPSDFELKTLQGFKPALWIAAPVLKVLPHTKIPGLTWLDRLPHFKQAACIYGGYWKADYCYPDDTAPHVLYGRSSNQELVQVPKNSLKVGDYVYLRPQQSEAVIPQFSRLYSYQAGKFDAWQTLRE